MLIQNTRKNRVKKEKIKVITQYYNQIKLL